MAIQTITARGRIVNCLTSRWNGTQALFVDGTGKHIALTIAKGVGTKGIKSSKKRPGAVNAAVEVTYTINETTDTKMLTAYTLL